MPRWGISAEEVQEKIQTMEDEAKAKIKVMEHQYQTEVIDVISHAARHGNNVVSCLNISIFLPDLPSWNEYVRLMQSGGDYAEIELYVQDELLKALEQEIIHSLE